MATHSSGPSERTQGIPNHERRKEEALITAHPRLWLNISFRGQRKQRKAWRLDPGVRTCFPPTGSMRPEPPASYLVLEWRSQGQVELELRWLGETERTGKRETWNSEAPSQEGNVERVNRSVMSNSLQSHELYPLCPWDSPGKNTGVGCHFLLHGIFPTQGLNLSLVKGFPDMQADSLPGKQSEPKMQVHEKS